MKRYIKDMNHEELAKLVNMNDAISDTCMERVNDTGDFWLDEYLHNCPCDYQITGCMQDDHFSLRAPGDYSGVNDHKFFSDFEDWIDGMQKCFEYFNEEDEKKIRNYIRYARVLYDMETGYITAKKKDELYVGEQVERLKDEIERMIYHRLVSEYDCSDERLIDEMGDWIDDHPDAYINGNDYTAVYEHVNGYYVRAHKDKIA